MKSHTLNSNENTELLTMITKLKPINLSFLVKWCHIYYINYLIRVSPMCYLPNRHYVQYCMEREIKEGYFSPFLLIILY